MSTKHFHRKYKSQVLYKALFTSIIESSSIGVIVSAGKLSKSSFCEFDKMSGESTGAVLMKMNPSYITKLIKNKTQRNGGMATAKNLLGQ